MTEPRRRGRPPKRANRPVIFSFEGGDDDGNADDVEPSPSPVKKGRGGRAPLTMPPPPVEIPLVYEDNAVIGKTVIKKIWASLGRTENDNELVTCGECHRVGMTFREFRFHNFQCHLNTAPTLDERGQVVMDHRWFNRRLNEFQKLTKMTVFACPKAECGKSFKTTLGLAYHMNTCGRTQEELEAVLLECEVCQMKFTLPNMAWHRKTHEEKVEPPPPDERTNLSTEKGIRRKSALIARKSFKRTGAGDEEVDEHGNKEADDDWAPGHDPLAVDETSSESAKAANKCRKKTDRQAPVSDLDSNDYTVLAVEFLEGLEAKGANVWDDPPRCTEDPLLHLNIIDNPLQSPDGNLEDYLPDHRVSVEFRTSTSGVKGSTISSEHHRLDWFEGESVEIKPATSARAALNASIHHTGGAVLSIAWHPSGKLLAVSVCHSYKQELDSLQSQQRKGCIQIYRRLGSTLNLHLVLGVDWGYATHIQWSSFCPDIMDSYTASVERCFEDLEIYARLGYLAMCGEDSSTVRIFSLSVQDFRVPPNYEYKSPYKVRVYRKEPEIELRIDSSVREPNDGPGNAIKFDWHEENKHMAVGYADGYVAVFNLNTSSPLLFEKEEKTTVINPFWVFHGHKLGVTGVVFDPMDSRYLVTCGQDRQMKVWDMLLRTERDNKRTGISLDMCWVRGWMHQVCTFENVVAYQSAMHNYVRVFQTGGPVGKPSSAEIMNVSSLDCYHGLTVQGTEQGKVSCTYYDWFWRECDYERNRRKKNLAVLSYLEVDKDSYEPFPSENFSVSVQKLSKKVMQSKLYQRLGINEDEGVYSIALESKFGNMKIFDKLPDLPDDDDEEDGVGGEGDLLQSSGEVNECEEMKPKLILNQSSMETCCLPSELGDIKVLPNQEPDLDEINELMVNDAISSTVTKIKDGLIPIYDVTNPEGEPRLSLTLSRNRPGPMGSVDGLETQEIEEYLRFQPFLRVNKVKWSPAGDVVAVGYRNGLITLLPGSFDSIFPS